MKTKRRESRKRISTLQAISVCFFFLLILFAIAALVAVAADKLILSGSLSFWIIDSLINNSLGQVILRIGTALFLPFFTDEQIWSVILIALIPVVLILVNVHLVRRIRRSDIIRTVCRLLVYFCFTAYIAAVSLSMVYTEYAWHVAKNFVLSENFDANSFESVQNVVKESKHIAQEIIDVILLELQNPPPDVDIADAIDDLDDIYYLELTETVAMCFQIKGGVDSREEHYLRNAFCRAPKTLDDMIKDIKNKSPFDWVLLSQADTVYHMQGENGMYNVKFVSTDGYHEAIYNKDGILLTEKNDPVNMGTFNYAGPITEPALHAALDILPYYTYGNCPASAVSSKENYSYQSSPDAHKRWRDLKDLLNSF